MSVGDVPPVGPVLVPAPEEPAPILPPPPTVPWYTSQRLVAVGQFTLVNVILWLAQSLNYGTWEWRKSLASPILAAIAVMLMDWWHPTIIAPAFVTAFKNKSSEMMAFTLPKGPPK